MVFFKAQFWVPVFFSKFQETLKQPNSWQFRNVSGCFKTVRVRKDKHISFDVTS